MTEASVSRDFIVYSCGMTAPGILHPFLGRKILTSWREFREQQEKIIRDGRDWLGRTIKKELDRCSLAK